MTLHDGIFCGKIIKRIVQQGRGQRPNRAAWKGFVMERLKNWYAEEKRKLGALPDRKGKLEYIWQYYKLWIIGIICALWFLIFVVVQLTTAITDYWVFIAFTNTYADVGVDSELWKGYVDYTGFNLKEKNVAFDDSSYFDYALDHGFGNTYYEAFVTYTDGGVLDAVTMEVASMEALGSTGRLMDLSREECASILEKYGDKFIYSIPNDTEYSIEPVPVGIDISDSALMTKYHIYADTCALGIGAQSQRLAAVEQFLDYLYAED